MGEAKRRGRSEKRAMKTKGPASASLSRMAEWANLSVDEDLHLYCSNLYVAAAHLSMPVENPEAKKLRIEGVGTLAFPSIEGCWRSVSALQVPSVHEGAAQAI